MSFWLPVSFIFLLFCEIAPAAASPCREMLNRRVFATLLEDLTQEAKRLQHSEKKLLLLTPSALLPLTELQMSRVIHTDSDLLIDEPRLFSAAYLLQSLDQMMQYMSPIEVGARPPINSQTAAILTVIDLRFNKIPIIDQKSLGWNDVMAHYHQVQNATYEVKNKFYRLKNSLKKSENKTTLDHEEIASLLEACYLFYTEPETLAPVIDLVLETVFANESKYLSGEILQKTVFQSMRSTVRYFGDKNILPTEETILKTYRSFRSAVSEYAPRAR